MLWAPKAAQKHTQKDWGGGTPLAQAPGNWSARSLGTSNGCVDFGCGAGSCSCLAQPPAAAPSTSPARRGPAPHCPSALLPLSIPGHGSAPALATSPAFQLSAQISLRGAGCLAPKSPARAKNTSPSGSAGGSWHCPASLQDRLRGRHHWWRGRDKDQGQKLS